MLNSARFSCCLLDEHVVNMFVSELTTPSYIPNFEKVCSDLTNVVFRMLVSQIFILFQFPPNLEVVMEMLKISTNKIEF